MAASPISKWDHKKQQQRRGMTISWVMCFKKHDEETLTKLDGLVVTIVTIQNSTERQPSGKSIGSTYRKYEDVSKSFRTES
jgi:hypothetical protein